VNLFILFRQANLVKATAWQRSLDDVPDYCRYEGRRYNQLNTSLSDFNHLLKGREELVGLEFPYCDLHLPEMAESRLVKETLNAKIDGGELQVILTQDEYSSLESDQNLVPGNWVYFDGISDHIIAVPDVTDWGQPRAGPWKRIGFEVQTGNVPECV
jgi:hypothetical protein